MGMSASQARLIQLEARQSNLEYQGQQINQERSILSQQCTDLYNSLLTMQVPTPPSTQDYTTVQYAGIQGASTFTLGNIVPTGDTYSVEMNYKRVGDNLQNKGEAAVSTAPAEIYVKAFTGEPNSSQLANGELVLKGPDNKYIPISGSNYTTYFEVNTVEANGEEGENSSTETNTEPTYKLKGEYSNYQLYTRVAAGTEGGTKVENPFGFPYMVGGSPCYTLEQANDPKNGKIISDESMANYIKAIRNMFPEDCAGKSDDQIKKEYMVYKTSDENGSVSTFFMKKEEIDTTAEAGEYKFVNKYKYDAAGTYTETSKAEGCELIFDTAGRITQIKIPVKDSTGKVTGWSTLDLEANKTTDEKAYQDAYNKYEYAMYEYDKKQQEINAKTEIIQQQDRNLELKLQRLDNERQQITTEIEAVQKVIDDNIEASYKTFSG